MHGNCAIDWQKFWPKAWIGLGLGLFGGDQGLRATQINAYQLRHAALGHGNAKQAIHSGHRNGMVGDDNEAGFGPLTHFIQQAAIPIDV